MGSFSNGETALIAACDGEADTLRKFECVHLLLQAGADASVINSYAWSALHSVGCKGGSADLVKLLVSAGAPLDERNAAGHTPLSLAICSARLEVGNVLLQLGADLEAVAAEDLDNAEAGARAAFQDAFSNGPHKTQVERRRQERWERRFAFVHFLAGCNFQPLALRQSAILAANPPVPPSDPIADEPTATPEQCLQLLQSHLFGNPDLTKQIVAFL